MYLQKIPLSEGLPGDLMRCAGALKFKEGIAPLHFALGLIKDAAGPGARC